MNKSKQFVWTRSVAVLFFVCVFASLFCVGCSGGNFAGTSEEPNEIIADLSSSSEEELNSSDSRDVDEISSSSAIDDASSSSGGEKNLTRSSSSREPTGIIRSSSSDEPDVIPMPGTSSSGNGNSKTPISDSGDGSLGYYLHLFNLDGESFDGNVLATTHVQAADKDGNMDPPRGTDPEQAGATEFDATENVYRFVKQNVGAIKIMFPDAYMQYSELISAIENETIEEGCGLYLLNLYGEKYVGHVLAEITSHKITVLDIKADGCKQMSGGVVRFLFKFCGEMDELPEIERLVVTAEMSGKGCQVVSESYEWIKN